MTLARMAEGEITLAETRYGLHIIRLDARATGDVLPFETVLPHIREAHEKSAWLRASRDFIASLCKKAAITGIEMKA